MAQSGTGTFLFTDIVNSTQLMGGLGDEAGQDIFRAHHKMLSDAVSGCGGEELQWMGDGMLAAFNSAADAIRCAIEMQQGTSRPINGSSIEIRVGVHSGEAIRRDGGYFGTPLVVARRICDSGDGGSIRCSRMTTDLLASRSSFSFRALGQFALKGIAAPVDVFEVVYQRKDPAVLLRRTPFVGRRVQLDGLLAKLDAALKGRGSVAMLVGEAGIGKTRLIEEFVDLARSQGAVVLRGNCYGGEWQPPYSPFAEILLEFARRDRSRFVSMVGESAPMLVRVAPGLNNLIDAPSEPRTVAMDEERYRMHDAVAQFLLAVARNTPLVVVLDDLHWADAGTAALLNLIARMVTANPVLVLGAYRDSDVDRKHPLTPVLAALKRLPDSESLSLSGLTNADVKEMLEVIGSETAPDALVQTVGGETDGNPFFIRELLLYLQESGKILTDGKSWLSTFSLEELGIPEGIKHLIEQRLARLSDDARALLSVSSAFKGGCIFAVAATVANLDEDGALSALDEAIDAQLLRPGNDPENLEFTHAIIQQTLYAGLNPARRARMHRRIADAMESTWGERANEHAAEVAYQFWRAGTVSGTDRGVDYAIAAADNAEAAYAHDEVAAFLRIGLELLPANDPRRTRISARLGNALIWTTERDDAAKVVLEAGDLIAKSESEQAAADYLEGAAFAMYGAGLSLPSWEVAKVGLRMIGERRDVVWASLRELDLKREEADDATNPGIRTDTPGQRDLRSFLRTLPGEQIRSRDFSPPYESREELVQDPFASPVALLYLAGDCRRSLPMWRARAAEAERLGRIARAARFWANVACCQIPLGDFVQVRASLDRAIALGKRASGLSSNFVNLDLMSARHDLRIALDEGWDEAFNDGTSELLFEPKPEQHWAFAIISANSAYLATRMNRHDLAMQLMGMLPRALERGAPWEPSYSAVACDAAAVLWYANTTEHLEVIEHSLREKVLVPDFRFPMRDARLSLARLCALRNGFDEAQLWFSRARAVLEEAGHRPLRSIVDHDEGLMYLRRGEGGDLSKGSALLQTALAQFQELGMTGWIRCADVLSRNREP